MLPIISTVILVLTLCLIVPSTHADEQVRIIRFGIVPQQSASKLARLWTPILNYVSTKTNYQFQFKTAPNIPAFEKRVASGQYDVAYMNPYHYTVFHRNPGYTAFAKAKDKKIQGIIVVRKDSVYQTPKEFRNQILAFPAPAAFAASVLPRAYFKQNNIPITPMYVSSHDSVYRTVAKGLYPAGGGIMRTFHNLNPEVQKELRILWKTNAYTPHAIAAHPNLPAAVRHKIQQVMINMHHDPHGHSLLASIKINGFDRAHNEDWDDVRTLGINMLDDLIKGK